MSEGRQHGERHREHHGQDRLRAHTPGGNGAEQNAKKTDHQQHPGQYHIGKLITIRGWTSVDF